MKPLIIYHADCTDGYGAAFAAWLRFGDKADYFPAHYGRCDTVDQLADYLPAYHHRPVFIIDFSFPRPVMESLMQDAASLVWLDHHATSFKDWCGPRYLASNERFASCLTHPDTPLEPRVLIELDNTRSGALIAWQYFHPDRPVPRLFAHIDDYDRWVFQLPNTQAFSLALSSRAPWTFAQWVDLSLELGTAAGPETSAYVQMLAEGRALLRMQDALVRSVIADAIPCQLPGSREIGLAVTCPLLLANDVGAALAKQSGTYGLCWYQKADGLLKVSLRSAGALDVSALAAAHGGGGHKGASGFHTSFGELKTWLRL